MPKALVLTIQVFKEGDHHYKFDLEANVGSQPTLRRHPIAFTAASPLKAVQGAIDLVKELSHHPGRGRKPSGYKAARILVIG